MWGLGWGTCYTVYVKARREDSCPSSLFTRQGLFHYFWSFTIAVDSFVCVSYAAVGLLWGWGLQTPHLAFFFFFVLNRSSRLCCNCFIHWAILLTSSSSLTRSLTLEVKLIRGQVPFIDSVCVPMMTEPLHLTSWILLHSLIQLQMLPRPWFHQNQPGLRSGKCIKNLLSTRKLQLLWLLLAFCSLLTLAHGWIILLGTLLHCLLPLELPDCTLGACREVTWLGKAGSSLGYYLFVVNVYHLCVLALIMAMRK